MQLFYAPDITPPTYRLTEEESKHAIRVLRLKLGDTICITDGRGKLFCCAIIDDNPKRCTVELIKCEEHPSLPYRLTMAVAPTKSNDRFEWFLEKATEVGVFRIIPMLTSHGERRVFKSERSIKVITSAVKQSLKFHHPTLDSLTAFKDVISMPHSGRKFIAHCQEAQGGTPKVELSHALLRGEDALILIGAEGDFSPQEIEAAINNGFEQISLGTQRLRTETAALVAVVSCSIINTIK